eukprot:CAMPEP_0176493448 /NCGR_PEP_ID=MMETSP0200_2-20121128/9554_1 /TAXON_ID=947934 /ORGANISM="Chaetoceros sp., Strain GSL56" /LENGTH=378 /DNA_ID=CAMNT_0017891111 /DNA_START=137 /DNA_END=1273 /DNA_ORIENTATION=-
MKVGRHFEVKACWSKAGIGTSILLQQKSDNDSKGFKLVFDLGCTPIFEQTISSNAVVISHGHVDHFGGIFSHARAHNMQFQGSIPSYYVPEPLVPKLELARQIFSDIDCTITATPAAFTNDDSSHSSSSSPKRDKKHIMMNIVPIRPGQETEIKQPKVKNGVRFYLRPFRVSHGSHPACGYTVVSKTTISQLKEQYVGMDGRALKELVQSGVEIKETRIQERPEVCYTGDTCVDGLIYEKYNHNPDECSTSEDELSIEYKKQGFLAPLFMSELTYLDPKDSDLARERGHLNVKDIPTIFDSHNWDPSNRNILFYHISRKHGPAERVLEQMIKNLPLNLVDVTDVAISSFAPSSSSFGQNIKPNGCISLKEFKNNFGAL